MPTTNEQFIPDLSRLNLPHQDLTELEFCHSNKPAKVELWVNSLPATRANHTSVLLYQALPQVAQLKTSPGKRLEILDLLRPAVHQCIQSLTKEFLNQPVSLPEGPLKTAIVAQALQKNLSNGYTVSALEILNSEKPDLAALALSLHRTISGLGQILLRGFQLYTQVPALIWQHLNSMMATARHHGLAQQVVADPLLQFSRGCTIEQAYNRILLLACINPNQIRQGEFDNLYQTLEVWAPYCTLKPAQQHSHLFLVNLKQDRPPVYTSRYAAPLDENCLTLDIDALLKQLDRRLAGEKYDDANFDKGLSKPLINHLDAGLRSEQKRRNERQPVSGEFEVCVGLTAVHQQLTGGVPFKQFLSEGGQKSLDMDYDAFMAKPLSSEHDPWAEIYQTAKQQDSGRKTANADSGVPIHTVQTQDRSPGGYCIRWRDQVPLQVKAGELIALRQPGRRSWQLAAIRWLTQQRGSTLLGLQLLASNAKPIAIAMTYKTGGESDYMRGLMLPEQTLPKQVESIITPTLPFVERAKVRLLKNHETIKAQLNKCLFSTGAVSQFTFQVLESSQISGQKQPPDDVKSQW